MGGGGGGARKEGGVGVEVGVGVGGKGVGGVKQKTLYYIFCPDANVLVSCHGLCVCVCVCVRVAGGGALSSFLARFSISACTRKRNRYR